MAKGVQSKPVCCYCHKVIDKKPIPVGDRDYAHQECVHQEGVRRSYLGISMKGGHRMCIT